MWCKFGHATLQFEGKEPLGLHRVGGSLFIIARLLFMIQYVLFIIFLLFFVWGWQFRIWVWSTWYRARG